jgi:hypothetical protein
MPLILQLKDADLTKWIKKRDPLMPVGNSPH